MSLPMCIVFTEDVKIIGLLFIANEGVVVIINNVCEDADLGPIALFSDSHIEPESSIVIIARNKVKTIDFLESTK